ncbi:hypothetical protein WICPIJ_004120, partial [Wickerhamomyces pijperi]
SGACAGTSTDLTFFPIDTLKTRLQAKGGFFANGGYKGIYRGLGSAVIASAPSASLFFITYDTIKAQLTPLAKEQISNEEIAVPLAHMAAASCGEIAACLVRVPAEVIKQRTQTSGAGATSWGTLQTILDNRNNEGLVRALYRGWGTTILREIPFTMIQFPLYEKMKRMWAAYQGHDTNPLQGALCGSVAGGIAAASTTPLDVLKTRIMLHKGSIGLLTLAKTMLKEEGPKVFFSGVAPRTMWISLGGAIFLGVYETVSTTLKAI